MARPQFRVTFDIVTPESSEHGDSAESGFLEPGGWRYAVGQQSSEGMSLREAVTLTGGGLTDSGRWFTGNPEPNYADGSDETRALHPPENISQASYGRLRRLLCGPRLAYPTWP